MTEMVRMMVSCLLVLVLVTGCSKREMTRAQKDEDIARGQEAIEEIKKNPKIPASQKKMMIERIQMEVEEQTGERVE